MALCWFLACMIFGFALFTGVTARVTARSLATKMPPTTSNVQDLVDDFFYYFAYGSNLLKERIQVQIDGARYEVIGHLPDYELAFVDFGMRWRGAPATIEPIKGSEVWGCIWRVPNSFALELDKQEINYERLNVTVEVPSQKNEDGTMRKIVCRTYRITDPNRKSQQPSPHYKHVIVSGAIEHKLPEYYIEQLKKIQDNGFKGRVELDLEAIRELNALGLTDREVARKYSMSESDKPTTTPF
uniref:gamma-glutamylcyclotransferase n=1 Tax=Panagrolaimus superbus TaxID=310955 RepID=A0A914Z484_9BILA